MSSGGLRGFYLSYLLSIPAGWNADRPDSAAIAS
jgi:hypothetical protein